MNNNTTQSLYHKSSVRISLGIILPITLLFNLGTSFYIFLRLKLSPHIKKILIALQFSNLLVTILIILGGFPIEIKTKIRYLMICCYLRL